MKQDIAFGQYCEGVSLLHRLDPRVKIMISILFIVGIFLAKSVSAFLLLTVFTVALVMISGISPGIILRSLKSLTPNSTYANWFFILCLPCNLPESCSLFSLFLAF